MIDHLHRTEALLNANEELRIGAADWLGGMLRRPPLSRPNPAWAPIQALVEALWWDIHDQTPDPLSPTIEGVGIVPQTHPRLIENHPWNREDR